MTLYLLKPVVWNTQGYVRPAGYGSQDSHPATHGFGHEEWNNAPAMATIEDGRAVRYFHTEKPGNAAVDDYLGDTVVFMVASHHGRQDLVGVGGRAEAFFSRPDRRAEIAASLDLASLEKEVWALSSARAVCAHRQRTGLLRSERVGASSHAGHVFGSSERATELFDKAQSPVRGIEP